MSEVAAVALTYGLVWTILLVYLIRLWRRLQQLDTDRQRIQAGSSPKVTIR